jgi:signal transduction histidine kinase/ActR/RegA family two-component response regulator
MSSHPLPLDDTSRLSALARSGLMDSEAEPSFDRVSSLASRLLNAPVALLSLVDDRRQFFKSALGLTGQAAADRETALSHSFCQHVVTSGAPLVVDDALQHPKVRTNPAIQDLNVKAYIGVPVTDPDGFVLGSFCVIDGQARSWSESDLATLKDLAALVMTELALRREISDRRTAQAALLKQNKALAAARDEAESAVRAKAAFLSNISHEIRTPMNAVIGMTELLETTDLNAEQREFTQTIRTGGETLISLINDLLDLSKIEAGRLELERKPVVLSACIHEATQLVGYAAHAKGLTLRSVLSASLPQSFCADPTRLRQILVNLLGNAVKFTSSGEVVLSVSQPNRDVLRFEVRDTGIGIHADQLERLFKPFSQADASTTRLYGGSGLGLAICHRLVMQMGGQIGVDSVPGQGSGFHFQIPFEPAPVLASNTPVHPPGPAADHTLKILIAEDHPVNQRVAQLMLRSLGYEATLVSDGLQVLQALAHTHFDLVLLDLQMPQLDGLECARRIRSQHPDTSKPWIVAVTANVVSGEQEACLAAGMNDFLAKPVTTEALRAALGRCLTAVSATAV